MLFFSLSISSHLRFECSSNVWSCHHESHGYRDSNGNKYYEAIVVHMLVSAMCSDVMGFIKQKPKQAWRRSMWLLREPNTNLAQKHCGYLSFATWFSPQPTCMHILLHSVNIIHAFQLEGMIDTDWLKLLSHWKVTWLISGHLIARSHGGDVDRRLLQENALLIRCVPHA